MNRAEKDAEINFIGDALSKAQIALCADYRGLTVSQVTQLRRELRKAGSNARVVKNTLASISAKKFVNGVDEGQFESFLKVFNGPSVVIWSANDPVAPAKVVADFVKNNEKLQVKGAWIDGAFIDAAGVQALSKMPGKQEILAKLLNLIMAPATQLVRLIGTPGTQVVRVIEAQRSKLEETGKS